MNTNAPAKKRPGLGSALAASLEGERSHVDERFARAEKLFGAQPNKPAPEATSGPAPAAEGSRPTVAQSEPASAVSEDDKVARVGFSLLKKENQALDKMFGEAVREAPRTTTSEVIRAALVVFGRMPPQKRMEEIRKLETPKLRRRRALSMNRTN